MLRSQHEASLITAANPSVGLATAGQRNEADAFLPSLGERKARLSSEMVARLWVLDLRRNSFIELGGASRPSDIWRCVWNRIDTDEITAQGVPVALSPDQMKRVKRTAKEIAEYGVTIDQYTVI